MKTILLFSRCSLVDLYGGLHKYLSKHYNVIHLAYSDIEESILRNKYRINEIVNFKKKVQVILENEIVNQDLYTEIDKEIISYSNGRFNLNSVIQNDRTFQYIKYEKSLLLSQVYYKFWNYFINNNKIDYVFHEPTSLYFNHIASIICKKYNRKYISLNIVIGPDKNNWIFAEGDDAFPFELYNAIKKGERNDTGREKALEFIKTFRNNDSSIFFSQLNKSIGSSHNISLFTFALSILKVLRRHFIKALKKKETFTLIDHTENFAKKQTLAVLDELKKKWDFYFYLHYDEFTAGTNYYYYPLHLEPEATVLYYADGIYKNQIKLIENVAASLPPNHYLYVKDHPHGGDYRDYLDYKRIKAIPNVKLLNPKIPGKLIISKSRGIITINGTSGFEAILYKKLVFTFGNIFYNLYTQTIHIKNIKDLRERIYENYNREISDNELITFISYYINSIHKGFVWYFANFPQKSNINDSENIQIVAEEIIKHLN